MTNFTRKFLDEFAKDNKNTDLIVYGSTASGGAIPSSDPEVLQGDPNFRLGWKGATLENLTNNTRNPVRNEWSALDYIHNYHINHILQKGGQEYNPLTEYYIDDLSREVGGTKLYKSLVNNNIGNALTDVSKWQFVGDLEDKAATELISGIAAIATNAETLTGSNDTKIVTPAKLQTKLNSLDFGSRIPLVEQDAVNNLVIEFTGLDATYSKYEIELISIRPANNDVEFNLRISQDGGTSFKSGASDYAYYAFGKSAANVNLELKIPNADHLGLSGNAAGKGLTSAAPASYNGTLSIYNPSNATLSKSINLSASYAVSAAPNDIATFVSGGIYKGNALAFNAIQFFMSSGDIAEGKFKLYGIK